MLGDTHIGFGLIGGAVRIYLASLILLCNATVCPEVSRECFDLNQQSSSSSADIDFEDVESRVSRLERRLRAMEQPVWLIRGWPGDWEICAEGPCKCQPETKSISCWKNSLQDLPPTQLIPEDTLKIDLGSNHLTALHRDTFRELTQLRDLDVSNNMIEHLPLNIFYSLYSLTHLGLSKNLLRDLYQSQFLRMRHLQIIDLSSNSLISLPEGLFMTNTVIVLLEISSNRISALPHTIFHGLRNLEELLITKNRLTSINIDIFKDLISLKTLRIDENRLRSISVGTFDFSIKLIELNLRDNKITSLPANLFLHLEVLTTLDLSSNIISRVKKVSKALYSLTASNSALIQYYQQIDKDALRGLLSLKELRLGNNNIKSIPKHLFLSTPSLQHLVLYANGIETLSNGDFRGLGNLTSLFLHSNKLRYLQSDILKDTPNLQKLQLEGNRLSYLPGHFLDSVPIIQQLRLARNPWHCDCDAAYLAMWLRKMYFSKVNVTTSTIDIYNFWESGAGAICWGPGTFGGKLVAELTFHELCEGQWASMKGLAPRKPIEVLGAKIGQ